MRQLLFSFLVVASAACTVGSDSTDGGDDVGGGGDDTNNPTPDAGPTSNVCALPATTADTGDLAAQTAQQCNVPMSQGLRKWYRFFAPLPGGTVDVVQVELWDGRGIFTGGTVAVGTYQLTGNELNPALCGVCVRAIGDKGQGTQKEYFATAGTVEVTAVGGNGTPISATVTNVTFAEVDPTTKAVVSGGCTASVARTKLSGTVVTAGTGGGGGGNCPSAVGE